MSEQTGEMTQAEINDMEVEYSFGDNLDDEKRMAIKIDNTPFKDFVISFKYLKPVVDEETETASLSFEYDVIDMPEGNNPEDYLNNQALHQVAGKIAMELFVEQLQAQQRAREAAEDISNIAAEEANSL